jgi:hypothetical protein
MYGKPPLFHPYMQNLILIMINSIKQRLLNRTLKNHKVLREKQIISLEKTRTLGLLCQITDENSYKEIYDLFTKLQSQKRTIRLLGYIDQKEVPYFCLPQLSTDYFSKKNLNGYGKPNFPQLKDFVNYDFDILIDFSRNDLSPLRYVLTVSKAKLIVGANKHLESLYDIFINDKHNLDNLSLLKTMHSYLLKLTGGATI